MKPIALHVKCVVVAIFSVLAIQCGSAFESLTPEQDTPTGATPDGSVGSGSMAGSGGAAGASPAGVGGSSGASGSGSGGNGASGAAGSIDGGRTPDSDAGIVRPPDGGSASDGGPSNDDGSRGADATSEATTLDAGKPTPDGPLPDAFDGADASSSDAIAVVDANDAPIDVWKCEGLDASPADVPCTINEAFGVFVAPTGNDGTGLGTKAAPYRTIGRGLTAAKAKNVRLYVCDNGTGYAEPMTLGPSLDGITAYGGFQCSDWSYAPLTRAVVKPAIGPALAVKGLSIGAVLENFEFDAPDATATAASSIGATVESSANVILRRVKIVAGKGGAGAAGIDGTTGEAAPTVTASQKGVAASCGVGAPGSQLGGSWPNASGCNSKGGNGGPGNKGAIGYAGLAGEPRTGVTPPDVDNGGTGGSIGADGTPGSDGDPGKSGSPRVGAGTFTSTGYAAAGPGGDGTDGLVGQGGGGGGASDGTSTCVGASGGAGGMGGCGGSKGTGGGAGGASVAILSWMSGLSLDACELLSKDGGAGGKGGNGGVGGVAQEGAEGGDGDDANAIGLGGRGGPGGAGGPGGSGAGGNGGPSHVLVYKGTAPAKLAGTTLTTGMGGAAGPGGVVAKLKAPNGLAGTVAAELAIP
jgi:hypothetical protein